MTIEEVKKLTDRELRIKVAELCGIKCINRKTELNAIHKDLNAMHEIECGMTKVEYDKYCDILWNMCMGASGKGGAINSTARQRAEAFVLTMHVRDCWTCSNKDSNVGNDTDDSGACMLGYGLCEPPKRECQDYLTIKRENNENN